MAKLFPGQDKIPSSHRIILLSTHILYTLIILKALVSFPWNTTTYLLHVYLFQKIYDQYVVACGKSEDSELQPVSYRTFCRYWRLQLRHVVIGRPRTDLCWTCQQNSMAITKMANTSDQQKEKAQLTLCGIVS